MKVAATCFAMASAAFVRDTHTPTQYPTAAPTKYPTKYPTSMPTESPTEPPTLAPTDPVKGCTVKLYKNCFYEGYVGTYGHGQQVNDLGKSVKEQGAQTGILPYAFDNDISSIKIEGDCAIYLYDGKQFQGDSKVLTSDAPCLVAADASKSDTG